MRAEGVDARTERVESEDGGKGGGREGRGGQRGGGRKKSKRKCALRLQHTCSKPARASTESCQCPVLVY